MYKYTIGAAFLLLTSVSQASYVYEFSGTIPNDSITFTHPSISAGETWVARFELPSLIDVCSSCASWDAVDEDNRFNVGVYNRVVEQATITFSGGFVGYIDASSGAVIDYFTLTITDNQYDPVFDATFDIVKFEINDGANQLSVLAITEDLSSLSGYDAAVDDPPPPGTSIVPSGQAANFLQLSYGDDSGTVLYGGLQDYNVSMIVTPIPAAVWLFGSGIIGLIGVARRRKV